MDSTTRYLDAPLIDGVVYEISDEHISIRSPHTCFISVGIRAPLNKAALLEQYRRLLRKAKENHVRVSYTAHIRKMVCENWTEYEIAFQEARRLFDQMADQAHLVEKRGIHQGWNNDQELERLDKLQEQFQRYLYRDSVISRMIEAKNHLDDIERYLAALPNEPGTISL